MDRPELRTTRTAWQPFALFAVMAGLLLFFALGSFRTFTSHEGYAVVPARTMMESGNWIVPDFGGMPRLRKPPLCYWVLATMGTVFGGLNETVARIPSALSALALAVLMGVWANRWYGRTAGWMAAFVQLTAVYLLTYARKAEVDMLLWLLITAALFLIANEPADERHGRNRLRWLGVSALVGVSWLAKFHYGPVMILAPTVIFFLVQNRRWDIAKLCDPIGLIMILGCVFLWPSLVMREVPNAMQIWYGETVGRAEGLKGNHGFFYYVPVLLAFFLPWTPFAITGMPESFRRAWRQGEARERFLWIWFFTQFLICSIQPSKHTHYIYCAFPVFTLFAARRLAKLVGEVQSGRVLLSRRWVIIGSVTAATLLAIGAGIGHNRWPEIGGPILAMTAFAGIGLPTAMWLLHLRRHREFVLTCAGMFVAVSVVMHGWVMPRKDHRQAAMLFADNVRETVGTETPVYTHGLGQHPVAYYLANPVRRAESIDAVNGLLETRDRVYLLTMGWKRPNMKRVPHQRIIRTMPTPEDVAEPRHAPLILIEIESPRVAAQRRKQAQVATAPASTVRQ